MSYLWVRTIELWVAGFIVVFDQATKPLVRQALALHESLTIVPGFLNLTHVRNTGAAFGILNRVDLPFKTPLLIGLAVVALVSIAIYAMSLPQQQRLARFGLALVLGGAVGNLIDRIRTGYVLDFVDVYWRDYHFWAFNVADSAITVGVVMIVLDLLLEHRTQRRSVGAPEGGNPASGA
jgi:signal peptidase II